MTKRGVFDKARIRNATLLSVRESGCVVMILIAAACHSMRFEIHQTPQAATVVEERNYFFLLGLVPARDVDVHEKCPNGAAEVFEQTTFGDGVIAFLTFGLVSVRTSTYYCLSEPERSASL